MAPGEFGCFGQLFNCAVLVACPRINDRQILGEDRTLNGALTGGHQFHRELALTNRVLLVSQGSINYSERAESLRVAAFGAQSVLKFSSCSNECIACRPLITADAMNETFAPTGRKRDIFFVAAAGGHGS